MRNYHQYQSPIPPALIRIVGKRDIPLLLTPTSQQTSHSRSHRYYPLVFFLIVHKTGGDGDLRAGAPALTPIALNSDVLASDIVDVYVYDVDR